MLTKYITDNWKELLYTCDQPRYKELVREGEKLVCSSMYALQLKLFSFQYMLKDGQMTDYGQMMTCRWPLRDVRLGKLLTLAVAARTLLPAVCLMLELTTAVPAIKHPSRCESFPLLYHIFNFRYQSPRMPRCLPTRPTAGGRGTGCSTSLTIRIIS